MEKINDKLVLVYFGFDNTMNLLTSRGWLGGAFDFARGGQYFYKD